MTIKQHIPALRWQMPPIIPFSKIVTAGSSSDIIEQADFSNRLSRAKFDNIGFICPMTIYTDDQSPENGGFTFPCDPLISFKGGFKITRRNVAKKTRGGSVKERWSIDDYTITITGTITGENAEDMKDNVKALNTILTQAVTGLNVLCPAFEVLEIERMCVESFDFPFTPGEDNQAFSITAYSDDVHQLLIELEQ